MNERFSRHVRNLIGCLLVLSLPALGLGLEAPGSGDGTLRFEPNLGQAPTGVSFLARARSQLVFLGNGKLVLKLGGATMGGTAAPVEKLVVEFAGARGSATIVPGETLPGYSNYYQGRSLRLGHVPAHRSVRLEGVYEGVDVIVYGFEGRLEYDFVLAPGADPSRIRLGFGGAASLKLQENGDLSIRTPSGRRLLQHAPVLYQLHDGVRTPVEGRFFRAGAGRIGISVSRYDRKTELVIDPVLSWATYFGGSDREEGGTIAADDAGNSYVCGKTLSTDFPVKDPYQDEHTGAYTGFVAKIDASGQLVWSTYLGGGGNDSPEAIALDAAGNVYVAGWTFSSDFPVANAAQGSLAGGSDAFVSKLSPGGDRLIYSSYLGGTKREECYGLAVDSSQRAVFVGNTESSDFPVRSAFQSSHGGGRLDGFVARFNASGSSVSFASYIGGDKDDTARTVAAASGDTVYLAGDTASKDFPVKNAYMDTAPTSGTAAFITKLAVSGFLSYSTYLGGRGLDWAYGIDVDGSGRAVVCGKTGSNDFPTVSAYKDEKTGTYDAFLARLSAAGSTLEYSSYFGGSGKDWCNGIRVGTDGSWSFAGTSQSDDYPLAGAGQAVRGGDNDAVITVLDAGSNTLKYSSYFGGLGSDEALGLAVDGGGNLYVAGMTESDNLPVLDGFQSSLEGSSDAFVLKVRGGGSPAAATYVVGPVIHAPGAHGSQWRSDLTVVNPGGSAASLVLTAKTSGGTKTRNVTVAAGGTLRWADVLVSFFGFGSGANVSGTVLITSSEPIELTSRAYSQGSSGTTGQFIPGLGQGDGVSHSHGGIVSGIMQNADFRTNLGAVNMGEDSVQLRITLYDTNGQQLGAALDMSLSGYQFKQIDKVLDAAGAGDTDLAYARVEMSSSAGEAWAYASVIDNHTNDPTTVPVALQ